MRKKERNEKVRFVTDVESKSNQKYLIAIVIIILNGQKLWKKIIDFARYKIKQRKCLTCV